MEAVSQLVIMSFQISGQYDIQIDKEGILLLVVSANFMELTAEATSCIYEVD